MTRPKPSKSLELWAGFECTVNRVGDAYIDQLELSGHAQRCDDIDLVADLGVKTVRYPCIWERLTRGGAAKIDWRWTDERLGRLRYFGIEPIVGFVHHGSGPPHTSLLDDTFGARLAAFAGEFAIRYPWIRRYTPVNEPLTTARFCALYGLWYPHHRDDRSFTRAFFNQCDAIRQAMRAIRRINGAAQLVQTEDIGRTYATHRLRYQADFENERRWLTFDLLCGRIGNGHRLWPFLTERGLSAKQLETFVQEPCTPNVVGINYYVTSERFLDERLSSYPACCHGGNAHERYADVEAVRARSQGLAGAYRVLRDAWDRYHLPLAITETQLSCTRDEQLRWLQETWRAAVAASSHGIDVHAVTVWSLLGAFGWNRLVTEQNGLYECGVFDVRSAKRRPTALAAMVRNLAAGRRHTHAVLNAPGWWRRPERVLYGIQARPAPRAASSSARPLLIIGAGSLLGRAFQLVCASRALACRGVKRGELDVLDGPAVAALLTELRPWAVINAAGYARVDDAQLEPRECFAANVTAPALIAQACKRLGVKLVTFSSHLVFDGHASRPYSEEDEPNPLSVYGHSKLAAEKAVMSAYPGALIVRAGALFGAYEGCSFTAALLRSAAIDAPHEAACDAVISPTYLPDFANAVLDLLIDDESQIWHLANAACLTWAQFVRRAREFAGLSGETLFAKRPSEPAFRAPRPKFSALGSRGGVMLPPLDDALRRWAAVIPARAGRNLTQRRLLRSLQPR
jgi:dTDP-4-dehydrorhamnose reductase